MKKPKNETEIKPKKGENETKLIAAYGYGKNDSHPVPIFSTEIESYQGKIFRTLEKACLAFQNEKGRK